MSNVKNNYLLIVAVVAVVAVVSLVMSNSTAIQGAFTTSDSDRVERCIDTDEDGDIYTKGDAQVGISKKEDRCNLDVLHQWYCKDVNNMVESHPRTCTYGCENGACLKQQTYR